MLILMDDLNALYARYDGPPPRRKSDVTSPACWEMMLRAHLRAVRLKRRRGEWAALPVLDFRIGEIHKKLAAPPPHFLRTN